MNLEAGFALARVLLAAGQKSAARSLLQEVTASGDPEWAPRAAEALEGEDWPAP